MYQTMEKLIAGFPDDLRTAANKLRGITFPNLSDFDNVLITGLGGSGIGGSMVAETLASQSDKPIVVNKNYTVPAWVSEKTLVVACSYSGNTEETLSAVASAREYGAQVAAITSGGTLLQMARDNHWPHIELPDGYPPRAAFGHSSVALFALMAVSGLAPYSADDFVAVADHLDTTSEEVRSLSKDLAELLTDRIPVIYAGEGLAGVAVRWRQQINENAKMLCWHHILPEMNHNELVGWAGGDTRMGVVFLRTASDHARTAMRMDLTRDLVAKQTDVVETVTARGENLLNRMYYLIAVGDWLSLYLAKKRGVDPVEVDVITFLKSELAQR